MHFGACTGFGNQGQKLPKPQSTPCLSHKEGEAADLENCTGGLPIFMKNSYNLYSSKNGIRIVVLNDVMDP